MIKQIKNDYGRAEWFEGLVRGFVKLQKFQKSEKKWVGGSSPNSDFFFFLEMLYFFCFFLLFSCFQMFLKKKKNWVGGWLGAV